MTDEKTDPAAGGLHRQSISADVFADVAISPHQRDVKVTFGSVRVNHGARPGPPNHVVIGRLVMNVAGAQNLTVGLFDFLKNQGIFQRAGRPDVEVELGFAFFGCGGRCALTGVERCPGRLLRVDGFRTRVDRPRTPPVPRVRKPPAYLDYAPDARFGIQHDDRQQSAHTTGDDFVVAAVAVCCVAATVLREWPRERYNLAPGRQGCGLPTHRGTLHCRQAHPAIALDSGRTHPLPALHRPLARKFGRLALASHLGNLQPRAWASGARSGISRRYHALPWSPRAYRPGGWRN